MSNFKNPILQGSYPDPSIVRVGGNFYLVNSSFEFFPGLPIHHSTDLVNWTLIGHGLKRKEQVTHEVCLTDVQSDGGIHAPTIRYHNGLFYIIATNVYQPSHGRSNLPICSNFIITATDPAGEWSLPKVIEGAEGIDPDLFFDDDGSAWYVGTRSPEDPEYPSQGEIWIQQLDLDTYQLIGEKYFLWRGTGGDWVEGPHMYKRNGRYYLMTAEGGTGFYHAITMASSNTLTEGFKSNPKNPILTSRHLSMNNWVNSTGHGDIVELEDGRWYMVCLGIRNEVNYRSNMGRETHLLPVQWELEHPKLEQDEDVIEWLVCAPETGKVEEWQAAPFSGSEQMPSSSFYDDFVSRTLNKEWTFRRFPHESNYQLLGDRLRLYSEPLGISEGYSPTLLGIRQKQQHFCFSASFEVHKQLKQGRFGLSIVQKDDCYLSILIEHKGNMLTASLIDSNDVIEEKSINLAALIDMKIKSCQQGYQIQVNEASFGNVETDKLVSMYYTGAYCCITSQGETGHFVDVLKVGLE